MHIGGKLGVGAVAARTMNTLFWESGATNPTVMEKVFSVPPISAFIKTSGRGRIEQMQESARARDREGADRRLRNTGDVKRALSELSRLNGMQDGALRPAELRRKQTLRDWNRRVYIPYMKAIKAEQDQAKSDLLRENLDLLTKQVLTPDPTQDRP
jgi:hypothetical protein